MKRVMVPLDLPDPEATKARSDALIAPVQADRDLDTGRISRAKILKMAVLRGLDSLEEDYLGKKPQERRR